MELGRPTADECLPYYADSMTPPGSGARRRTGRCAACAPSRTTSRATSDISPTFAGNTAGSTAPRAWWRPGAAVISDHRGALIGFVSATAEPAALRARRRRAAAASSPSGKSPSPAAPPGCSPPTPSGPRRCSAAREEQVGSAAPRGPEHRIERRRSQVPSVAGPRRPHRRYGLRATR